MLHKKRRKKLKKNIKRDQIKGESCNDEQFDKRLSTNEIRFINQTFWTYT